MTTFSVGDIPVGTKIRANFEGSMWTLVANDDGTYDLAYPMGHRNFGGRTTNSFTRDRIKEAIRTGTWSVIEEEPEIHINDSTPGREDTITDLREEIARKDLDIDQVRMELEAVQNERNSMMEVRQQNEDRRIAFLEYLATVAEDPGSFGVDESRMCENFDAAMIRHGHYSRSEVDEAREKAAPDVDVMISMSARVTIPRSVADGGHYDVWAWLDENDMINSGLIDEVAVD